MGKESFIPFADSIKTTQQKEDSFKLNNERKIVSKKAIKRNLENSFDLPSPVRLKIKKESTDIPADVAGDNPDVDLSDDEYAINDLIYKSDNEETFEVENSDKEDGEDIDEDETTDISVFYKMVNHHYEQRENGYQCLKCKFVAGSEAKIATHIGAAHNGFSIREGKRFKCIACEKTFKNKWCLDVHIRSFHEGFSLECEKCDFRCKTKGAMNTHLYKVHGKSDYGVKCDICDIIPRVLSKLNF